MSKLVLGYWDVKGLGASARLMLEYGGVDYEDRVYTDYDDWFKKDKIEMGLDFPNMPYLIDGDVQLTERGAIYRYIGRKIGLEPATDKAQYEADMLDGVLLSFSKSFGLACYSPDIEEMKPKLREKQEAKLAEIEKFIEGRDYLTGPKMCFVDFFFYTFAHYHRVMFPDILEKFPNIEAFMRRFESHEKIAAYLQSERHRTRPIMSQYAYWGGEKGKMKGEVPAVYSKGLEVLVKGNKV